MGRGGRRPVGGPPAPSSTRRGAPTSDVAMAGAWKRTGSADLERRRRDLDGTAAGAWKRQRWTDGRPRRGAGDAIAKGQPLGGARDSARGGAAAGRQMTRRRPRPPERWAATSNVAYAGAWKRPGSADLGRRRRDPHRAAAGAWKHFGERRPRTPPRSARGNASTRWPAGR
jgi:hypothetical protein